MAAKDLMERIKSLPPRQKMALSLITIVSIALMAGIIVWSNRVDYQVLFSNLSEEDASAVVVKLNEMRIPHRVVGRTIYVPGDRVYELRLQLAAEGVPQGGGVGFEIFDKPQIGVSEFVQKLNYRRALQGELARTIRQLQEVEQCRVHIAIPERTLFSTEEQHPSASVVVKLKPGRTLTREQVGSIVHLVSSAVEGLSPKYVTVVDSRGNLLSNPSDGDDYLSEKQLEYQKFVNSYYEKKLQGMLENILGKGKAIVRVSAAIDFTRSEMMNEKVDPDSVVVKSEERVQEKTVGGVSGGVPGVLSNEPGVTPQVVANAGQSQNQKERVEYETSRIVSKVIKRSGEIKRISVAVLVDGTYKEENGKKVFVPRSQEELKKFEEIVKAAIGFDEKRGDRVIVESAPFQTGTEELEEAKVSTGALILGYAGSALRYLIPIIVAILVIFLVVRPALQALRSAPRPTGVAGALQGEEVAGTLAPGANLREQVIEMVKQNPRQAAMILREWLQE